MVCEIKEVQNEINDSKNERLCKIYKNNRFSLSIYPMESMFFLKYNDHVK